MPQIVVLSAAVAAATALGTVPASAEPADPPDLAGARASVDSHYARMERATEQYNAAKERADRLRRDTSRLQESVARGQERVNRTRGILAGYATAQYRTGGIDPSVQLLLSTDPDSYLDRAATLERLGEHRSGQLHALTEQLRALRQQRAEATAKLARLEAARAAVARHKREVRHKLTAARRLLRSLPSGERAAAGHGSPAAAGRSPDVTGATAAGSPRSAAALAAARQALGAPYGWGQAGPSAFDCSGLTQWAYARAGVAIPRTSQAQRGAGSQVSLSQARPGDLVLYRSDASHVAMYAGAGQVIHAPHPGARVRYDPVGMMPISAITRP